MSYMSEQLVKAGATVHVQKCDSLSGRHIWTGGFAPHVQMWCFWPMGHYTGSL